MKRSSAAHLVLPVLLLLVGTAARAQEAIQLGLVDYGSRVVGYYNPQRLTLEAARPSGLRAAPAFRAAQYALLRGNGAGAAGRSYLVALDEPANGSPTLYVDTNGDGDLTNDPPTTWSVADYGTGLHQGYGSAFIDIGPAGAATRVRISLYRFDPKDTDRAAFAATLFYYADYARSGVMKIGSDSYPVALYDEGSSFDFRGSGVKLLIDLNHDGVYTAARESTDATQPFNVGGTTREIQGMTAAGDSFKIVASSRTAAAMVPPPDLRVGKSTLAFSAVDIDGAPVSFPKGYAGKIVMLDFWATWCGPCMGEVAGLAAVYAKYKGKGFDVLGVSLDDAGAEKTGSAMRAVMKDKGMAWRQICDGRGWESVVAQQYLIDSIPHAFLVDGDTGTIIANGDALRGASLETTVAAALKKKGKI